MRTVLFAAASTVCLAFAAHGSPAIHRHAAPQDPNAPQPLSSTMTAGPSCIERGASLKHAAYHPDGDSDCCGSSSQFCSQYLSTQALVQAPLVGHT
jgi:hypothetical protein